jgi:hypothetical protein
MQQRRPLANGLRSTGSGQDGDEHRAAIIIQKLWKGYLDRQHVRIRTLADGIVHVAIKGNADLLARLDIEGIETAGSKEIDYVSVDPKKFDIQLAGGEKQFLLRGQQGLSIIKALFDEKHPGAGADDHVIINGGYYNVATKASTEHEQHASIGLSLVKGKNLTSHVPVPADYEDHFATIDFPDGSKLTTGPELYRDGKGQFDRELLNDPRFQWRNGVDFTPGMLRHAEHANARAAIVLP